MIPPSASTSAWFLSLLPFCFTAIGIHKRVSRGGDIGTSFVRLHWDDGRTLPLLGILSQVPSFLPPFPSFGAWATAVFRRRVPTFHPASFTAAVTPPPLWVTYVNIYGTESTLLELFVFLSPLFLKRRIFLPPPPSLPQLQRRRHSRLRQHL